MLVLKILFALLITPIILAICKFIIRCFRNVIRDTFKMIAVIMYLIDFFLAGGAVSLIGLGVLNFFHITDPHIHAIFIIAFSIWFAGMNVWMEQFHECHKWIKLKRVANVLYMFLNMYLLYTFFESLVSTIPGHIILFVITTSISVGFMLVVGEAMKFYNLERL